MDEIKKNKGKIKKRVKVSFLKTLACFTMILDKSIRYILKKTPPLVFRIPENLSNLNTTSRCFNFSFSIEGHSNLNCLQRKSQWWKGWLRVLFACLVNYCTILKLNCTGWRFFLQLLKWGDQNKMVLWNFGNSRIKIGVGGGGADSEKTLRKF